MVMVQYRETLEQLTVAANDMQLTQQRRKLQNEARLRKQQQRESERAANDAVLAARRDGWSNSPPAGDANDHDADMSDAVSRRVRHDTK